MTFAEVEQVIGTQLPPSARNHHAWWGNHASPRRQSYAWLSVGWRTQSVSIVHESVVFRRCPAT